jgi:lysophospholipase L1-like esterase
MSLAKNAALSLVTSLAVLAAGEAAMRFSVRPRRRPLHRLCDCPYLYGLDPSHPEVSSQGLRGRDYAVPKPKSTRRVLVLGDSVAYGVKVRPSETFSNVVERLLDRSDRPVEVLNAGVLGYTPWNELQYYRARGRDFQPDVVVVAFCMNDVVDPVLHWSETDREISKVPEAAIPNPEYHSHHVARLLGPGPRTLFGARLELARRLRLLFDPRRDPEWQDGLYATVDGRRWPTYVTAEDDFSIRILTDYDSPEWKWLRSVYEQLRTAVEGDSARLVVLVLPLAYQLEEGYPFRPQEQFRRYCAEAALSCVDVLDTLRAHRGESPFPTPPGADIWHLTPAGHRIVAAELARAIEQALAVETPSGRPGAVHDGAGSR